MPQGSSRHINWEPTGPPEVVPGSYRQSRFGEVYHLEHARTPQGLPLLSVVDEQGRAAPHTDSTYRHLLDETTGDYAWRQHIPPIPFDDGREIASAAILGNGNAIAEVRTPGCQYPRPSDIPYVWMKIQPQQKLLHMRALLPTPNLDMLLRVEVQTDGRASDGLVNTTFALENLLVQAPEWVAYRQRRDGIRSEVRTEWWHQHYSYDPVASKPFFDALEVPESYRPNPRYGSISIGGKACEQVRQRMFETMGCEPDTVISPRRLITALYNAMRNPAVGSAHVLAAATEAHHGA